MPARSILVFFVLQALRVFAQEDQLITYDAVRQTARVTQLQKEDLVFRDDYRSNFYNMVWQVPEAVQSTASGQGFSDMSPVSSYMQPEQYPASAAVKISSYTEGEVWDKCSGMMVGERFVLTAAHCVLNDPDDWSLPKEFVRGLFVQPAFHDGNTSRFGSSPVTKVWVYRSYYTGNSRRDLALLELERSLGRETGWVNMAYDAGDRHFLEGTFYNFSYPMDASRLHLQHYYNGDTMYLKSGTPQSVSTHYIGIPGSGIPGESGSLLLKQDDEGVKALGVRNFSEEAYSFYRLKEDEVSAFYSLMTPESPKKKPEIRPSVKPVAAGITVYPNPMTDRTILTLPASGETVQIAIFDMTGKQVLETRLHGEGGKFLFENPALNQGNYILIARDKTNVIGATRLTIRK